MAQSDFKQTTAYKNNVKRTEHRLKRDVSVAGASVAASAAADQGQRYANHIRDAKYYASRAEEYRGHADKIETETRNWAKRVADQPSNKGGIHLGGRIRQSAPAQAADAGKKYRRQMHAASAHNKSALKSLKSAKKFKLTGLSLAGGTAALGGTAVYQHSKKKNVRRDQLRRDKMKKAFSGDDPWGGARWGTATPKERKNIKRRNQVGILAAGIGGGGAGIAGLHTKTGKASLATGVTAAGYTVGRNLRDKKTGKVVVGKSAFGVEHEVSKAKKMDKKDAPKMSTERRVLGTVFGPLHSAVAAEPGKKLRATTRSAGYGIGGNMAGRGIAGGVAALATRGKAGTTAARFGGPLGGTFGANRALHASNRRGYYKKEKGL